MRVNKLNVWPQGAFNSCDIHLQTHLTSFPIEYSSLVVLDKPLPGCEPKSNWKHNKRSRTVEMNAVPSFINHVLYYAPHSLWASCFGFSEIKVIPKGVRVEIDRRTEQSRRDEVNQGQKCVGSISWIDCHDPKRLFQGVWCNLPKLLHKETDESLVIIAVFFSISQFFLYFHFQWCRE